MLKFSSICAAIALASTAFGQDTVPAQVILTVGDTPAFARGGAITDLKTPFTAEDGSVGFVGTFNDRGTSRVFIWQGDGPVFFDDQAPAPYTLSGTETSCGVASSGRFIYSPSIATFGGSGTDGIWASTGYITRGTNTAPGIDDKYIKAASGPTMFGDGHYAFMTTLSDFPGGVTTGRALYKGTLGDAEPTLVYKTGDLIDGREIRFATPTLSFTYDVSDNTQHIIQIVGVGAGLGTNTVVLDGHILVEDGQQLPNDPFEGWENFGAVSTNSAGDTMIAGDLLAEANIDAFVAFNLQPVVREGDTVAGITLTSPASVRTASLNNQGRIAHLWQYTGPATSKVLFLGDGTDLRTSSVKVVAIGDLLDTNGDGIGDLLVMDLPENTLGTPGLDLGDDGAVYTTVIARAVGTTVDRRAIVRFCIDCPACPRCPADFNQDGGVDGGDVEAFFGQWEQGLPCADVNTDGGVDGGDVETFFRLWEGGGCG